MVWGFIRVAIFTTAFLAGFMLTEPADTTASSGVVRLPGLDESPGASLVVACGDGKVIVKRLAGVHGAVQLDCVRSRIVVVRGHGAEKIPETGAIRNFLWLFLLSQV